MGAKTFILSNKRTWKREVRVFVMNQENKFVPRLLPFTTEGKVPSGLRQKKGKTVHAEYTTDDPVILEAMYRDSAYGKDFYERGDEEGKLKRPTLMISDKDKKMTAVRGLFAANGLYLDESLPYDVLMQQYQIHVTALAGTNKIGKSTAKEIPHVPVNPQVQIGEAISAGRAAYEEKYGESLPEELEHKDLIAAIDSMSNPSFDTKKFVDSKMKEINSDEVGTEETKKADVTASGPTELEILQKQYFEKHKKNVPNVKKSDAVWIKAQL